MTWTKPKGHSKTSVNRAGDILTNNTGSNDNLVWALEILDNWRASHSYPMHIFKKRLREKALLIDKEALVAQRLKRVPSIISKLKRNYSGSGATMNLSQIQDIGGCRAVLSDVILVRKLYKEYYVKGDLKHKKVGEKDYIANPKYDGYRSIHLIYRYNSDKGNKEYNGLLIEVQIRSKLQHLWATAVETVDFFTRQAIKSNEGQKEWVDFFRLVSSAFAKMENCPTVPDTPIDDLELKKLIREKEIELNVIRKMANWATSVKEFEEKQKSDKNAKFFLLDLDILGDKLNIITYTQKEEQKAIDDYLDKEKKYFGRKEYDVVLVGAETNAELRKAYPNYFVDTKDFISYLKEIIK